MWADTRAWAHWSHFFHIYLSYLGPVSNAFHTHTPQLLSAHHGEWLRLLDSRYCSFWVACRLRNSHLEGWNCWWLWHTCLLIWQEIFHFTLCLSHTGGPLDLKLHGFSPHVLKTLSFIPLSYPLSGADCYSSFKFHFKKYFVSGPYLASLNQLRTLVRIPFTHYVSSLCHSL